MKQITLTKKNIIITTAAFVILIALIILGINLYEYLDGINEASRLKFLSEEGTADFLPSGADISEPYEKDDDTEAGGGAAEIEPSAPPAVIMPKYSELLKINKEVIGWIKLEGTRINYPMLQHDDNEYYLHVNIEGRKSKRGCVYIDYRNSSLLTDKNTLIYAHNMKDGSMFKTLVSYKKKDFFVENRFINIDTLYEKGKWEVFSVYVVDADKETINIDYSEEGSFMKAMEGFKKRSMFEAETTIGPEDRIVTLVTCSYETTNSRTIIHAKYVGRE